MRYDSCGSFEVHIRVLQHINNGDDAVDDIGFHQTHTHSKRETNVKLLYFSLSILFVSLFCSDEKLWTKIRVSWRRHFSSVILTLGSSFPARQHNNRRHTHIYTSSRRTDKIPRQKFVSSGVFPCPNKRARVRGKWKINIIRSFFNYMSDFLFPSGYDFTRVWMRHENTQ